MSKLNIEIFSAIPTQEDKKILETLGADIFKLIKTIDYINEEIKLPSSKKPHCIYQLVNIFLNALSSKNPTTVHYDIATKALKSTSHNSDISNFDESVKELAHELNKNCRDLLKKIALPKYLQILLDFGNNSIKNSSEISSADKESHMIDISIIDHDSDQQYEAFFKKQDLMLADYVFLKHLSSIGKNGKEAARVIQKELKENNKNSIEIWFNTSPSSEKTYISEALLILSIALWKDKVKEEISLTQRRKTSIIRASGHLIDQIDLSQKKVKPTLRTQKEIMKLGEWDKKVIGIELDEAEHRLLLSLNTIRHKKSQNKDALSNSLNELIKCGDVDLPTPTMQFLKNELYKEYYGHDNYGGNDIEFVNKTLKNFISKKFLVIYKRVKTIREGNKEKQSYDRAEYFGSLVLDYVELYRDLTEEQNNLIENGDMITRQKRGQILLRLHPIFIDQIDTKYIEYPSDINSKLSIAAGGAKKVTKSSHLLHNYLSRELSNKRYKPSIGRDNLIERMGLLKFIEEGRKSRADERIDKEINTLINLGMIISYEKENNTTGGIKYTFTLNKNYL